jgi:hypothetical protein
MQAFAAQLPESWMISAKGGRESCSLHFEFNRAADSRTVI